MSSASDHSSDKKSVIVLSLMSRNEIRSPPETIRLGPKAAETRIGTEWMEDSTR
jgi:hypothetical protein